MHILVERSTLSLEEDAWDWNRLLGFEIFLDHQVTSVNGGPVSLISAIFKSSIPVPYIMVSFGHHIDKIINIQGAIESIHTHT